MTSHSSTSVSVLGLGPMGRALASALLSAGHPTTVWNRTAGKAEELIRQGATEARSPAAAIHASDVTVCCVLDDDAVQSIVDDAFAERESATCTLVNLTADSPHRTRDLSQRLATKGITLLDGAIMTPAAAIGTDATRILYSGPRETHQAYRDVLAAFGGESHYLGEDVAAAATYDVALLSLFWTSIGGLMHALAMVRLSGIEVEDFAPHGRAMAQLLADIVPILATHLDTGHFSGADSATLDSLSTSLDHLRNAFAEAGVPETLLQDVHELVDQARTDGHGGDAPIRLADLLSRTA